MAIVRKTSANQPPKRRGSSSPQDTEASSGVSLPDEPHKPSSRFSDYTILLYGEKKIGKTTLCSAMPKPFFLMTEPGATAIEVYQRPVTSWREYLDYVKLLKGSNRFETVVVDIVDNLYTMCTKHVCQKLGILDPAEENDWGKSWRALAKEWEVGINALAALPGMGKVFISHAKLNQITKRDGTKFDQLGTTLSGKAEEFIVGLVDMIMYYGYNGQERELVIRGDDFINAGVRNRHNFLTKSGQQVRSIPMGENEEVSYRNLIRAWENRQVRTGEVPYIQQRKKK